MFDREAKPFAIPDGYSEVRRRGLIWPRVRNSSRDERVARKKPTEGNLGPGQRRSATTRTGIWAGYRF